jgi:hypothetical protein
MRLDRVTITGADETIGRPDNLLALTKEFPFVEWGILISNKHTRTGDFRFPASTWISDLMGVIPPERLSLHVCGSWVREMLMGTVNIPRWIIPGFGRIQLNFHEDKTKCKPAAFHNALFSLGAQQFIFQIDGAIGNKHLESLHANDGYASYVDAVPLFDISGGAGILPTEWPKPMFTDQYHGYAGGLGPDNLEQQLPLIAAAAGETRIWIDMETRVRSDDDLQFDLAKVRRCLEIAAPMIEGATATA